MPVKLFNVYRSILKRGLCAIKEERKSNCLESASEFNVNTEEIKIHLVTTVGLGADVQSADKLLSTN